MERAAKARTTPLDRDEEAAWRAIARAVLVVPRTLDADLLAGCGLSLAEYIVLVNLSEAPGNSMRMYELAVESTLSPSGATRLIVFFKHNHFRASVRRFDRCAHARYSGPNDDNVRFLVPVRGPSLGLRYFDAKPC